MKKQLLVLGLLFSSASVQAAQRAAYTALGSTAGAIYYWFVKHVAMNVVGGPTAAANAAAAAANAAAAAATTDVTQKAINAVGGSLTAVNAGNSITTMMGYVNAVQNAVTTWITENPTTTTVAASGIVAAATAYGLYTYFRGTGLAELTDTDLNKLTQEGASICRFNVTRGGQPEEVILLNGTQIKGPEIIGGNTDITFKPSRNYQQTRADQVCKMVLPQRGNLAPVTIVVKGGKATQVSGITIQTKDITYVPIGQ